MSDASTWAEVWLARISENTCEWVQDLQCYTRLAGSGQLIIKNTQLLY